MSDLERFVELYRSFGIELEANKDAAIQHLVVLLEPEDRTEKLWGYSGFYSVVAFDQDGKFLYQGFWE